MKNIFKITSIVVLFLLVVTLLSNFIFWQYPLNYLSYKTGYKVETINNLLEIGHGRLTLSPSEYEQACRNFNSAEITKIYGEMSSTSGILIGISLIAVIIFYFILKLDKEKTFKQSKNITRICILIFIMAAFMFVSASMKEWELDFRVMCNNANTSGNIF